MDELGKSKELTPLEAYLEGLFNGMLLGMMAGIGVGLGICIISVIIFGWH